MTRLESPLIAALRRPFGWLFDRLPHQPHRVVEATARLSRLDGNLQRIELAERQLRPATTASTAGTRPCASF